MCGIVGMINGHPVAGDLVSGIQRLEYRGYDSAGVATVEEGRISRRRAVGPVSALRELIEVVPLSGHAGIAHTRWATHGSPSEANAHPHVVGEVAVVHNGIIENHDELREELLRLGREFASETDTEVVAHLLDMALAEGLDPMTALDVVSRRLRGSYAIGMITSRDEDALYATCHNGPLVVAEHFAVVGGEDEDGVGRHDVAHDEAGDLVIDVVDAAVVGRAHLFHNGRVEG